MAGGIVKFVGDIIYCTRSRATNFIRCGDDKEEGGGGALKVGGVLDVIFVLALVAAEFNDPSHAILLISSSINVNIMQALFQNIFLSFIITEIKYYYDQLLIIQVITTIIVLIWTLIDVINGYLPLCLIKFDSITINSTAASISHDNLPNILRGYAITCCGNGITPNCIRCHQDREEAGDGVVLELKSRIIWAYFTLFAPESDSMVVNSSAALMIDNDLSNKQQNLLMICVVQVVQHQIYVVVIKYEKPARHTIS